MFWFWFVVGGGCTLAALGVGIWIGRRYGWTADDLTDHR